MSSIHSGELVSEHTSNLLSLTYPSNVKDSFWSPFRRIWGHSGFSGSVLRPLSHKTLQLGITEHHFVSSPIDGLNKHANIVLFYEKNITNSMDDHTYV